MSLASVLRNTSFGINSYKANIIKGAKRKMERTVVLPSEHLTNLVKNRKDSILLTDEFYPPWVLRQQCINHEPHVYDFMAFVGHALPDPYDVPVIVKTLKNAHKEYKFQSQIEYQSNRNFRRDDRDELPVEDDIESDPEYMFLSDSDDDWFDEDEEDNKENNSKDKADE